MKKIGGVDCYVATPIDRHHAHKLLLFLPDVFGPQLINSQVRHVYPEASFIPYTIARIAAGG